jgi:WD40 repeat protein
LNRVVLLTLMICLNLSFPWLHLTQAQEDPEQILTIEVGENVRSIAWHPTENILASVQTRTISFWDTSTGNLIDTLAVEDVRPLDEFNAVSWSPDGEKLAIIGDDFKNELHAVLIFDMENYRTLGLLPVYGIVSFRWSPDGTFFATADNMHTDPSNSTRVPSFRIWDTATLEGLIVYHPGEKYRISDEYTDKTSELAWVSDTQLIFLSLNGMLEIYDTSLRESITLLPANTKSGYIGNELFTGFAADTQTHLNAFAYASFDNSAKDRRVTIVDLETYVTIATIQDYQSTVTEIHWQPEGDLLATANNDGHIRLWSYSQRSITHDLELGDRVMSVSWDSTGTHLAGSTWNGAIYIWKISSSLS